MLQYHIELLWCRSGRGDKEKFGGRRVMRLLNSADSEEFGGQSRVADREDFSRQLAKIVNSSVDEELGRQ